MDSNSSFSACSAVSSHVITSLTLSSICFFSSSSRASLNLSSLIWFFMLYAYDSREFLASIFSLANLSSSAYCSASRTMRSMSSLERRPLSLVMVMLAFFPDADLSSAVTLSTPLASTSKVTSTWGTPRGAGGMPPSSNLPSRLLSFAGALTLEHLDQHTWLVVGVCGESLGLLGWDGGVAGNKGGHHTTSGLETHGEWRNIEEEEVRVASGATSQHTSLHSCAVGNSLIWVDGAVWLLAVEEVGHKLADLRDASGATNHDYFIHRTLVNLGVAENLLDWLEGATEQVGTEILEASTSDGGVEVDALKEGVDLEGCVGGGGQVALGTLTSCAKTTHGTWVGGEIFLVLALELLHKVVHHAH